MFCCSMMSFEAFLEFYSIKGVYRKTRFMENSFLMFLFVFLFLELNFLDVFSCQAFLLFREVIKNE